VNASLGGEAPLEDALSRPPYSPCDIEPSSHRAIEPTEALLIVELRRRRMTRAWIAASEGASYNTGSRLLERAGLYELCCLAPTEPVVHYEHERPGGLLQIDTKKLGPIERPSHSLASNRRESFDGAGWKLTLEDSIKLIST